MEKNDGLSEIICQKCLKRLQIAYDFKKEAIATNRHLRSFISKVNKQFQQVTSTNNIKTKKEPQKDDANESYDELEEDMQELLEEEHDGIDYKEIDGDSSDEHKKTIDRDQLVEILGDNNSITILKPGESNIQEDTNENENDEQPENMEVFLVEENSEMESSFIIDDYEQNTEFITDEQYLEDDENDDQIYETVRYF